MRFIFLVCTERSGSNFITSLMNGHRDVSGPPPTHLFRLFGTNDANYGALTSDPNWYTLIDDVVLNFACTLGTWETELGKSELASQATKRTSGELLRLIYEAEAEHDGASHVFVKENQTYSFAPYLLANFPDCKFALMVRDPRDVVSSWLRTESIPGGVKRAVDTWTKDQQGAQELRQRLDGTGRMTFVRYEDLVNEPEATIAALLGDLDLPPDADILSFHRARRTQRNADRIEAWKNLGKPILRGNTRNFVDNLPPVDIRYVELRCHRLMQEFGYTTESLLEVPSPDEIAGELSELEPQLNPGSYAIGSAAEQQVRKRRLEAIDTVLNRRLAS